ncbi:MAG: alpha/beta hydrolase [Burkholderiaceae bacterium]|nr:alpha/beta hydrolase [Burkholderiaceae bacterium]
MSSTIFRNYDQAALDAEYDNRRKVTDSAAWLARYARWSEAARATMRFDADLAYGESAGERLDLFYPDPMPAERLPVNLFIHGGYWKALDKADHAFVARGLCAQGAITAVVNYTLMPTAPMDELVAQCRRALAWLHRNVARLGGDPGRLHVCGHSAGGHLTATTMATDWPRFAPDLPARLVRSACGISGLYDLEPIRLCYLNQELGLDAETSARQSPVNMIPAKPCPLLLCVGELEGPEYLRQSEDLATAWSAHGASVRVRVMPGDDHFSIAAALNEPGSTLSRAIGESMRG